MIRVSVSVVLVMVWFSGVVGLGWCSCGIVLLRFRLFMIVFWCSIL